MINSIKQRPGTGSTDSTALTEECKLAVASKIDAVAAPGFMTSLARGLAVLQAFGDEGRPQTVTRISQRTGIPRGAVRRCLYTLQLLGFVDAELNNFSLRSKALWLGYSYLSSTPLVVSGQHYVDALSRELDESCSLAVLEDGEVLHLARSGTTRVMSAAIKTGSRLPAYCTSLGRVMLAHLPSETLHAYFAKYELKAVTDKTVTSQNRLREILITVRQEGFAISDEELELGLRSIAVPVRGASGQFLGALNIDAQVAQVSVERMRQEFARVLQRGARELSLLLP